MLKKVKKIDGFFVFGHNIFIPDLSDAISGAAPGMSRPAAAALYRLLQAAAAE